MSRSFLIGNFLRAYGQSFGRLRRPIRSDRGLSTERLAVRFDERARRHGERGRVYVRNLQAGFVAALLLVTGSFRIDLRPAGDLDFAVADQEVVVMEEIAQTRQLERPPPPPRPPVPVEVPNDAILDDVELDLDASLDVELVVADLPPPPPDPVTAEEPEEPEIFYVVEQMPEMIGGMAALVASLDYPELARKAELEGMVVVQIVIPPTGVPQDPRVVRSVGRVLDNAAVDAVMKQTFTPGRQRGKAVTVAMNIPVVFKLS
jgi:protein TonB